MYHGILQKQARGSVKVQSNVSCLAAGNRLLCSLAWCQTPAGQHEIKNKKNQTHHLTLDTPAKLHLLTCWVALGLLAVRPSMRMQAEAAWQLLTAASSSPSPPLPSRKAPCCTSTLLLPSASCHSRICFVQVFRFGVEDEPPSDDSHTLPLHLQGVCTCNLPTAAQLIQPEASCSGLLVCVIIVQSASSSACHALGKRSLCGVTVVWHACDHLQITCKIFGTLFCWYLART